MAKLLVTGGAGFIGAHFVDYVLAHHPEDTVICLDSLTYAGNLDSLRQAMGCPRFRFIRGDITDQKAVFRLFAAYRPDMVLNFAAESHVDRSIRDPGVFLRTNILGTQVLMDACLQYDTGRFHQISTDEVYGDLPLGRPDLLFTETTPLCPSSPYAASKASADMLVGAYCRTFHLSATISRCCNNYGPRQFPEKLIPLMIVRALAGEPLPIYGTGENVRDWLYVEDHCAAVDLIVRRGRTGEIYHIGGHQERSNLQVVKAVLQALGKPESPLSFVVDRPGHDLRYALDARKLRDELGWEAAVPFEEGIKQTVQWYCTHTAWWEAIVSGRYREKNERLAAAGYTADGDPSV